MRWKACRAWGASDLSIRERSVGDTRKKMTAESWEMQATYDNPRLSEMVDMYEKIGFEVHLVSHFKF